MHDSSNGVGPSGLDFLNDSDEEGPEDADIINTKTLPDVVEDPTI